MSNTNYLETLPLFGMYFITAIALTTLFITAYMWLTPYRELEEIKKGNLAPAITLSGSLLGFILPLSAVIRESVSLLDMAIWGLIALAVQMLVFVVINRLFPWVKDHVAKGETSAACFLAALSLAAGLLNAACMTY